MEKMEFEEVGAAVSPLDIPASGNAEHAETADEKSSGSKCLGAETV